MLTVYQIKQIQLIISVSLHFKGNLQKYIFWVSRSFLNSSFICMVWVMPRSLSPLIHCLFLICFCSSLLPYLIIQSCEVLLSLLLFMLPETTLPLQLATCPAFVYDCNWALLFLIALSHMFIAFVFFFQFHKNILLLCLADWNTGV